MKKKKAITILIIILFLQGVFTNIHHLLMPSYVKILNLPDYMFGFFFAFMNLGLMVAAPFWGNLADHGKKKISVVLGYVIYGSFQYLFGLSQFFGPWSLSVIRFLSGFGIAASFTILISEIMVISEDKKKARNIAFGAAALAIGGAIGQFLGGLLYRNSFLINYLKTDKMANVLLIQGMLAIILAFLVLIFYQPEEVLKEKETKRVNMIESLKRLKTVDKRLIIFLISLIFFTMAQTNIDKYLDVYFINDLGYLENVSGQFKMIVGFVSVLTSVLIAPLFMKFKNRISLIAVFQIISGLLIFIVFKGTKFSFITYLYTFYMLYIIIKTINEPLDREYVSTFANKENIGVITGIRQSFYSLGTIIGPILGAFLYDYDNLLVFYVAIIFFIISFLLIIISNLFMKKEIITSIE